MNLVFVLALVALVAWHLSCQRAQARLESDIVAILLSLPEEKRTGNVVFDELERRGSHLSIPTLYIVFDRLERKGVIQGTNVPTNDPRRGFRPRRHFTVLQIP